MTGAALTLVLWLAAPQVSQAAAPDSLAEAKQLYAAGNYEDALARLSGNPRHNAEVDQYRALCLLALGRTAEVDRSLEELVGRDPLFKMSELDVSPRLVTIFQTVRRRLLPDAAKRLYTEARKSFDEKRFDSASAEFQMLLVLFADEDLSKQPETVADIKQLAEGFLKLSEAEVKAAASAAAAAAAAAPPPLAPAPATFVVGAPEIYSIQDAGVIAPVPVSRPFPAWTPRTAAERQGGFQGILRIVVDEGGSVEAASLLRSVFPTYDQLLLETVKSWQFRPATKDGRPVKYQQSIPIAVMKAGAAR